MNIEHPEKLTIEEILSEELLDAVYEEKDLVQRQIIIGQIMARAKELKIKQNYQELIKAKNKKIKDETKSENAVICGTQIDQRAVVNQSDLFIGDTEIKPVTGKWIVNPEEGIYYWYGQFKVYAAYYPIIISKRFNNRENGKEEVELQWLKDTDKDGDLITHSFKVSKSIVSSNTKIVMLSDYGFPVTSETSRALVSYLSDYEKLNPHLIEHKISTGRLGWIDRRFMPYDIGQKGNNYVLSFPPNSANLGQAVKYSGSYEAWLKLALGVRKSKQQAALAVMAASFGSVILSALGMLPALINCYGISGCGKTVLLNLAMSIWGDPRYLIAESTSTTNNLEQSLNLMNHLPFGVDDLSKITNKGGGIEKLSEMIYMLCSGQGKGRLNRNLEFRDTSKWCNFILTNIERPLADNSMQGGAINRVIDFQIQERIFEDGNRAVNICKSSYGHAGMVFIRIVQERFDELREIVDKYEALLVEHAAKSGHVKEQKQILPMAVILAADELSGAIFNDGIRLDIDYCVESLKNVDEVSEMERALQHIEDEVAINRMHYVPDGINDDGDRYYRSTIFGYQTEESVAFVKAAFEDIARKYNFSAKQFLSWADKKGILDHNPGRNDKRMAIPTLDKRQYCYVLITREEDQGYRKPPEPDDEIDQMEIPFD